MQYFNSVSFRYTSFGLKTQNMISMNNKQRSTIFTSSDYKLLESLIFGVKHIIECPKTDIASVAAKTIAWEDLCKRFNAKSGGAFRSSKFLREKYEILKQSVKKQKSVQPVRHGRSMSNSDTFKLTEDYEMNTIPEETASELNLQKDLDAFTVSQSKEDNLTIYSERESLATDSDEISDDETLAVTCSFYRPEKDLKKRTFKKCTKAKHRKNMEQIIKAAQLKLIRRQIKLCKLQIELSNLQLAKARSSMQIF